MPLFGRRSRSVSVSRPTTPSSNSPAMLAASQAFLGSQSPQNKLATGAAATALRSMSPTSTPVSQVQTRRMMERQASVSSFQGAQRGRSRGNDLQRRSSSASMTDRTFRQDSPGRPSTSGGTAASRPVGPPVPPLPDTFADVPPLPQKSHKRASSIDELQTRKTAAQRQPANRNSVAVTNPPNPASAAAKSVTRAPMASQLERIDSNSSHNFSYPGRARPSSPTPQKQRFDPPPAPTAPSGAAPQGISATETHNIQHRLTQAAQQPVKRSKKREGPLSEGSHFKSGTMGAKPTVTPLAPAPPVQEQDSPDELGRGQNNAKLTGQASHFPPRSVSPTDSRGSDSDSERNRTKRAQRASGVLAKQPSIVREDWEGEQAEQGSPAQASLTNARPATNKRQSPPEANVSRKIESAPNIESPLQEANGVTTPGHSLQTPEPRKPSLSPSRSARFSNRLSADITEGQKHEPPPRSVSPRKPALKHPGSPQMPPVDADRPRESSLSPSEATDLSADGAPRRKKNAHVKFDSHPAVVGVAAELDSPVSPQLISPQNQNPKDRKWFSMKRASNRPTLSGDSDDEDAMKPRPQLPTFGSVRGSRRTDVGSPPSQAISHSPASSASSISSGTGPTTMDTSISSDHTIGGLLARQTEHPKVDLRSPLAPEVTSVEGTGMCSDEDSTYSQDEHPVVFQTTNVPMTSTPAPTQTTAHIPTTKSIEPDEPSASVPSIAVQPATPANEEEPKHKDQWLVDIPGGFPSNGHDTSRPETSGGPATPQRNLSENLALPSRDAAQVHPDKMPSIQEDNSDKDSVYSDAAEDLSDMEGDGFGSINAIVHSPVPTSPTSRSTPPDSPVTAVAQRNVEQESQNAAPDWEATGARWKDNRENIQRVSIQPDSRFGDKAQQQQQQQQMSKPVAIAADAAAQTKNQASPASTVSSSVTPAQSPTPAPKGSGRDGVQKGFGKSMRMQTEIATPPPVRGASNVAGPKSARTSMVSPAAPATSTVAARPAAAQPAMQTKTLRSSGPPPRQPLPPVNNDSDSESSFRRKRRSRANEGGKYTMRRSMRAGSGSEPVSSATSHRDVRSMSPVERRPFSPAAGQPMRTTLRGTSSEAPTLRGNKDAGRRSSFFSRKSNKSPSRPATMGSVTDFRKSPFGDADDKGDTRPSRFQSRFADSSDEEGELRPVRGIPRRDKDEDSTDLEDSSDEETKTKRRAPTKKLSIAVPGTTQIPARPMSITSQEGKRKRGFFGRLRKNKDPDEVAGPSSPAVNGTKGAVDEKKKDRETAALGFRSDAEKEALIEQTRQKIEAEKAAVMSPEHADRAAVTSPVPRPTSPTPGKLQRRKGNSSRVLSESWPLPPKIPDDTESTQRPFTSDGTGTPARPALGDRQTSSGTAATSPGGSGEVYGRKGKKKRFPLLRKAFGLKD